MTDPFEPPAESETEAEAPPARRKDEAVPTEVEPGPDADALVAANGDGTLDPSVHGPMREIAAAFRMNAEALHTLKQMQVELAANVKRGDRSELVLQSTRALNDTFRNLSTVQRELLQRLDKKQGGGRGPLIPLMLLGLLIVFVAGIYVILAEVQDSKNAKPAIDPAEIVQRERDSWKEGRREGAQQSEREIRRLSDALEEAKDRGRTLQQSLDEKVGELGDVDRARRAAEQDRDEFAGQVRKAQSEVLAKKALEDEIHSLRDEKKSSDREVTDLEERLERKRREAAWLRQRLADYGMDLPADDPPYVPPGTNPDPDGLGAAAKKAAEKQDPGKSRLLNLLTAGQKKLAAQDAAAGRSPDDSRVPPPRNPDGATPGASRGGDPLPAVRPPLEPGELPPPVTLLRSGFERDPRQVQMVRNRINNLLGKANLPGGQSLRLTRIDGVSQSGFDGVILLRYDAAGRMLDSIEAKNMRITFDSESRSVQFDVHDGVRVAKNRRVPLPATGAQVVVAEGEASSAWMTSGLTMITRR